MKSPYRLLKVIGSGGWAEVWRAAHRQDPETMVAFKRPHAGMLAERRMRREIDIQRQFAGGHVMPILDADEEAPWFVMPLAEGNLMNLWEAAEVGPDRDSVVLDVLSAIAAGPREAHQQDVVHRDLTPANILALPDTSASGGRRWGLVRRARGATTSGLTRTGQKLGTDGFAAPETLTDSHRVDARADVYSVGRILAWLLTDRWPRATIPLLPPTGPWRGVITAATELQPSDRPRDLDELLGLARRSSSISEPRSARQKVRQLVNRSQLTNDAAAELRRLARHNPDDERLYIDELAQLDVHYVEQWAHVHPDEAAQAATTMCTHLRDIHWIGRDLTRRTPRSDGHSLS